MQRLEHFATKIHEIHRVVTNATPDTKANGLTSWQFQGKGGMRQGPPPPHLSCPLLWGLYRRCCTVTCRGSWLGRSGVQVGAEGRGGRLPLRGIPRPGGSGCAGEPRQILDPRLQLPHHLNHRAAARWASDPQCIIITLIINACTADHTCRPLHTSLRATGKSWWGAWTALRAACRSELPRRESGRRRRQGCVLPTRAGSAAAAGTLHTPVLLVARGWHPIAARGARRAAGRCTHLLRCLRPGLALWQAAGGAAASDDTPCTIGRQSCSGELPRGAQRPFGGCTGAAAP